MYEIINGIKIFYERRGHGQPLIMLHGNGESHEIFNALTARLESRFTLFLPDSRGHGRSERAPLDYTLMAEDVYLFIDKLGIQDPIVLGFSDGGITALILAALYPRCLSGLIAAGANLSPAAFKRHIRAAMKIQYFFCKKEDLRLMLTQPEISKETLKNISVPSLILTGEKDVFPLQHAESISNSIDNSKLIILKGQNHYSYVCNSVMLAPIIEDFYKSLK